MNFARVFTEDKYCDILIRNIKHYQQQYQFRILGYVIMPSHFHWILEVDPTLGLLPVEAGRVQSPEDYLYSSARNYLLGDHSVIWVDTHWQPHYCHGGTMTAIAGNNDSREYIYSTNKN